jgi:hypothetical protein
MKITIKDVKPLQPLKVIVEDENGKTMSNIFYLEPQSGEVYNLDMTIDAQLNEEIDKYAEKKQEEIRQKMMGIAMANPEQARMMGIDLSKDAQISPSGIIMGG